MDPLLKLIVACIVTHGLFVSVPEILNAVHLRGAEPDKERVAFSAATVAYTACMVAMSVAFALNASRLDAAVGGYPNANVVFFSLLLLIPVALNVVVYAATSWLVGVPGGPERAVHYFWALAQAAVFKIVLLVTLVSLLGRFDAGGAMFVLLTLAILFEMLLVPGIFVLMRAAPARHGLERLPDGELREAIAAYLARVGFDMEDIFIDPSENLNAFAAGVYYGRIIVLNRGLVDDLGVAETVAVLAHEVGHHKRAHFVRGRLVSVAKYGAKLALLWYCLTAPGVSRALGAAGSLRLSIAGYGFLRLVPDDLAGLLSMWISRGEELEADRYSARTNSPRDHIDALRSLSGGAPASHPVYHAVKSTHPTTERRVRAIEEIHGL